MNDLTGKKFGKLVVIERSGSDKHRNVTWLCKCDCGNEKIVVGKELATGNTKSCGCLQFTDLTGQRFGMLTVLERAGSNKHRSAKWLCRCDCGTEKVIVGRKLITGSNVSCGYCKERFCKKCGRKFKKANNRQKYCEICKTE